MMILRFLNIQGIAGLAASLALAFLLVLQKGETRHWRKSSDQFEQLYHGEQSAFAGTVANYRAAAEEARAADLAAAERVAADQRAISQRSNNALETRLADARARANQLRFQAGAAAAFPGGRAATHLPGLPAAAGGTDQSAGQDGLSLADERACRGRVGPEDALTATEQAIQLDELIKWVRRQAAVPSNGRPGAPQHAVDP